MRVFLAKLMETCASRRAGLAGASCMCCVLLIGCGPSKRDGAGRDGQLSPQEVAELKDPNVVRVVALYHPFNPWIWARDKSQVVGITTKQFYLVGPDGKGVFGDGIIRPRLFELVPGPGDSKIPKLVKEWNFTVEQTIPFRTKEPTVFGWGYRLFMPWKDLNLAGKDVRLVIEFERPDGAVISSDKKDFRVPLHG